MGRLVGRSVVVTGAASGIGAATVQRLLQEDARVVAVDRDAERLFAMWPEATANLTAIPGDVAALEGVERAVSTALEAHGGLDGFVANAAITRAGTATDMTPETWDDVLRVNLTSVYLAAHVAIPVLRRPGGSFVAVASQVGLVGYPENVAYCAAKGGIINLVRAIAIDVARDGIRINSCCPGPVDTPMLAEGFPSDGRVPRGRCREGTDGQDRATRGDRGRHRLPAVLRLELHDRGHTGGGWWLHSVVEASTAHPVT